MVILICFLERIRYLSSKDKAIISELTILDLFTKLNGDTIIHLSNDGGYWLGLNE